MNRAVRLGEEINRLRKQRGLSQREFGRRIGVSQQQVAKLEAGNSGYSLSTLEKIAGSLGLKLTIEFGNGYQGGRAAPFRAPGIDRSEADEIEGNLRWFGRLSPIQKIRAVELSNQATKRLWNAARELRRPH